MSQVMEAPPKFLPSQWHHVNQVHYGNAEAARSRSERVAADSQWLVEESDKATQRTQQDVSKKLEQRIQSIQFWRQELERKLEDVVLENESLLAVRTKLERALKTCSEPRRVTLQCLAEREKRVGIDLVHDDVEKALVRERDVIGDVSALLQRTLEQTIEQMRLNRSAKYSLEKDLRDKYQAEQIDDYCCGLSSATTTLAHPEGDATSPRAATTPAEWEVLSELNIRKAEREKSNSLSLRALADSLLEQTAGDLRRAHQAVARTLDQRVQETKRAKRQLDEHLAKILDEISSQEKNILLLQEAITGKQAPLKVAQVRLSARNQRPHSELCHDPAQARLHAEVQELSGHANRLSRSLSESEAQLRALRRAQLALEEEIQVKAHSLYIDDVLCSQLLQSVVICNF